MYFNTPVFVFGDWNPNFSGFSRHEDLIRASKQIPTSDGGEVEVSDFNKESSHFPLRWCHADLAFIPTQRSLNVLFFETGTEGKERKKQN